MRKIPELKIIPYGGDRKLSTQAIWGQRLALISLAVVSICVILFRVGLFEYDTVLTGMTASVSGGLIAIIISIWSILDIRRQHIGGMKAALTGLIVGTAILLLPLSQIFNYILLPSISDISTDLQNPPIFAADNDQKSHSEELRVGQIKINPEKQLQAYPDIRPMLIKRNGQDAYNIVHTAAEKLNWNVGTAYPPRADGTPGQIQAIDRTFILGLKSNIAIRIVADGKQSMIDVRSVSRSDSHDLGKNADRIRRLFATVQTSMLGVLNQPRTANNDAADNSLENTVNTKPKPASATKVGLATGNDPQKISVNDNKTTTIGTKSSSTFTSLNQSKEPDISNPQEQISNTEKTIDPNIFGDQVFAPNEKLPPVDPLQRRELDDSELASTTNTGTNSSAKPDEESLSGFVPEGENDNFSLTTPEKFKKQQPKKKYVKSNSAASRELMRLALPESTE